MKLVIVVLIAMVITQFALYHELDKRMDMNVKLDDMRWKTQLEVFKLHTEAINKQTEFLIDNFSASSEVVSR